MNAATPLARTADRCEYSTPVALRWHGRTIAKLVVAHPPGELVLAMPYRSRQTVQHVSVPPAVLAYARRAGARRWIVRLDERGECYTLPLSEVERLGWLKRHRDGHPEWFVPLSVFRPAAWVDWEYTEESRDVDAGDEQHGRQLSLFAADGGGR